VTLPVVTKEREREISRDDRKRKASAKITRGTFGMERKGNQTRQRSKKAGEEREESRTTERRCTDNT
jgi:hypothetical protein